MNYCEFEDFQNGSQKIEAKEKLFCGLNFLALTIIIIIGLAKTMCSC